MPCIARWPGRIPAGHVNHALAIIMDIFPTVLGAAGVGLPSDRLLDGRDIMPLFTSSARSPHEVIFGMTGPHLATVRDERWKLHIRKPSERKFSRPEEEWIDPRAPDGVTILAPFEQFKPNAHPGLRTGDAPKSMMLFDLRTDPGEQHDVAAEHPEVVARLKAHYDAMSRELSSNK